MKNEYKKPDVIVLSFEALEAMAVNMEQEGVSGIDPDAWT